MKLFSNIALATLLPLAIQAASAADWYPSEYGAHDQIGAANLIEPYICRDIIRELPSTMKKYGINKLEDIIGGAHNG